MTVHDRTRLTVSFINFKSRRDMMAATKIQIVFYSMYGHIEKMAQAVAKGARQVSGVEVDVYQVPELVPKEILEKSGADKARAAFAKIPTIEPKQLAEADGIIFGTPTRYGNMCAQMRNFLDQTGGLWVKNMLVGKVGSVFTSTGAQHGGQETTVTSFHSTLLHLGMVIVGLPYSETRQTTMAEITGGSPYGASTITGGDGKRQPSENELAMAEFQGKYVAEITRALKRGRES
jgi:NAD(P)H dehydrogenase (quinone)